MTPETIEFARDQFIDHVQTFYDDPYGVMGGDTDYRGYVEKLKRIAADLSLDYVKVVTSQATPTEIERIDLLIDT